MQPLESLKRYTVYMHKYLRTKTYLEYDDPELWDKLTKYLTDLRNKSTKIKSEKMSNTISRTNTI